MKKAAIPRAIHPILQCLLALALMVPQVVSAGNPESTHSIRVSAGWNLLSLPAGRGGSTASLFPSAISPAYTFNPSGEYDDRDSVTPGLGFWLKFGLPETIMVSGVKLIRDTIECEPGWNIVGTISCPVDTATIVTSPPGIITSQFFEYVPGSGYLPADTLFPGLGYWVKLRQGGSFVLSGPGGPPCPGVPTVDFGGKTYNTVLIGDQCWMRENLDIGIMVDGSQNQTDNAAIEKYCYDNNPANCEIYGGLYQWDEAMQYATSPGAQGICPPGWHVPMQVDLQTLSTTVGGDGNALKEMGQGTGGGVGTNTSGFGMLLAGSRWSSGNFYYLAHSGYLWSAMQSTPTAAQYLYVDRFSALIGLSNDYKTYGFSVRCLMDRASNQQPDTPTPLYPDSLQVNVTTSPTLRWSCSDPDGDFLTYDAYFGSVNPPDTIVSTGQVDTTLGRVGLTPMTTYYWRVVARDYRGDSTSGPVWSFTTWLVSGLPCPGIDTVDYAGKTYHTVRIGSRCWLKENLNVGDMIVGSQNATNNGAIEKYCYNDSAVNCETYGGLYQWDEAMQYVTTQGARGICPPGWHIPTRAEFQALSSAVNFDGNAMKREDQGSGAGQGTNTSGFSALIAGTRNYNGSFSDIGSVGFFWSSTMDIFVDQYVLSLNSQHSGISFGLGPPPIGFSVRCIKN